MTTITFTFAVLASFFFILPSANSLGISCTDHPAYHNGLVSVLARSWETLQENKFHQGNYHPRHEHHSWAPRDDPTSTKYKNLDFFWAYADSKGGDAAVRLHLQRRATVYIAVVPVYDSSYPTAAMTGWKSEGYAERVNGSDSLVWGVHQKHDRWMPRTAYMFSRVVSGYIDLPDKLWVQRNAIGIRTSGNWLVLLAEEDGKAPADPLPPGRMQSIIPNTKCPKALHDMWVTQNIDDADEDTVGKVWKTWHPMWDPCYWCAYDHEHGSSPKHLMGYEPRYEYVAWKNGREKESHNGFKGMVFRVGSYFVYWSIHGQTSKLRRTFVDLHTVTLAIADANTKELLVELNHKGYFGFLGVRIPGFKFMGLTEQDNELMERLAEDNWASNKRSVNVIDLNNLDPRYSYRSPRSAILAGEYEEWTTRPICTPRGRYGMINADFANPATGIKSARERNTTIVLGRNWEDSFIRNDGSSRIVELRDFEIAEELCVFHQGDITGGKPVDGLFYTDATGKRVVPGPSRVSVRQFIKPGFKLKINGSIKMRQVDIWTGMFTEDADIGLSSYGFGIDPDEN